MASLDELLEQSAALHRHLCPRQVLGVQMGRWIAEILALPLPQSDKRLLTIVETDGCFTSGVAVATGCWVGRRTMRVEDYGKVAATFVDTATKRAVRLSPHPLARHTAHNFAPETDDRWHAMLLGYQRMPLAELFVSQDVTLVTPVEVIVSTAGQRAACERCGEEILNGRELLQHGETLCRACAHGAYYRAEQA